MFKKKLSLSLIFVLILALLAGCGAKQNEPAKDNAEKPKTEASQQKGHNDPSPITLATTTSTDNTGLLDVLVPAFTKKTGIQVKWVAVGTGQAIKMGEAGDADVLLVHSRPDEDKFVADGYGAERYDVMYNDFVILGPKDDPAKIKGLSAADALKQLAAKKATFISRGDDSGTNKKELRIWAAANIEPKGSWYVSAGQGMGATLQMASEKGAYVLSDRGTYLAQKDKLNLDIVVEGDKELFNPYGVIPVSKEKFPNVKYGKAMQFVEFIRSPEGQQIIADFGKDKYGQGLFIADADGDGK